MTDAWFSHNISLLRAKDPHLAAQLESFQGSTWHVLPTKNSSVTLQKTGEQGPPFLLHSAYNPEKEAAQFIAQHVLGPTADVVFLGCGLGYHIDEFLRKEGKRALVLIVENEIEVLWHAFRARSLELILTCPQCVFAVGAPLPQLFDILKEYGMSFLANGVHVIEHPPSMRLHEVYYSAVKKTVTDVYTWTKVNINTQLVKAEVFSKNCLTNLPHVVMSDGVITLGDVFAGKPGFIISAGPSLDKNVQYLKEVKDRGIIIAVDSAVRTLVTQGIIPDIVVSIDFSEHNACFLESIPSEKMALVFDPEVHPSVPAQFKGKKFVISLPHKALCEWIATVIGDKGRVEKGMSVSHTAFLLALMMKLEPIVFVGQDLSYPRGAWHTKGSHVYQSHSFFEDYKKRLLMLPGYFGGTVTSETSLHIFLKHFESIIHRIPDRVIYNATEGGVTIPGVKRLSLREAIIRYCREPLDKSMLTHVSSCGKHGALHVMHEAGMRLVGALTECNHYAYEAMKRLDALLEGMKNEPFNVPAIMAEYKHVIELTKLFQKHGQVIDVIRDNAIEALLIRAKRDMKSLRDGGEYSPEDLKTMMSNERMFFQSIVRATDFLSKTFCETLTVMYTNYLQPEIYGKK